MNAKQAELTRIGNEFIADFGLRYDMPELVNPSSYLYSWTSHDLKADNMEAEVRSSKVEIRPRGQFAAGMKDMDISFRLYIDQHDRCSAEVIMRYGLHQGGQNGIRQEYFLVTERDFLGSKELRYSAFIRHQDYNVVVLQHAKLVEAAIKEGES